MVDASASRFADGGESFNGDAEDQHPGDPTDLVALAAAVLREAQANAIDAWRERDRLEVRLEKLEDATSRADEMVAVAEQALIRAVMVMDPRPFPTRDEWFRSCSPLWKVVQNGQVFALAASSSEDYPSAEDEPEFAKIVVLVVLDLATIGVVH
jgi:hypothetical protein